jgi:hypothetical protein
VREFVVARDVFMDGARWRGFVPTAVDEDLPSSRDSDANPGTVPPVGLTRFAITASSGDGVAKSNPGGGGFPPADARVDGSGRAG